MKSPLSVLTIFFASSVFPVYAQIVYGIYPVDSVTFNFNDSVHYPVRIKPDSTALPLWQLGITHKAFFCTGSTAHRGLMTDTAHPYKRNANNFFILKAQYLDIITFWHSYQTDSQHAGGIVEFSVDTGITWDNVEGACNTDDYSGWHGPGVKTSNFYSMTDTLLTGESCFSGSKHNVCSQVQVLSFLPIRMMPGNRTTLDSPCNANFYFGYDGYVWFRFRFQSDSSTDTLGGWLIDSIKVRTDYFPGRVGSIQSTSKICVMPNPSATGVFQLGGFEDQSSYKLTIFNELGIDIINMPFSALVDISSFPKGWYFYRISNGEDNFTGRMLYR